jgi:hypothetical protein
MVLQPRFSRAVRQGRQVQRSTKVELFIDLKTAKALGLNVPQTMRSRAK